MPSPFPGMDPYIESQRNWSDFHNSLGNEIRTYLNNQILPAYYATTVTYVAYDVIEIARSQPRSIYPDVGVWRTTGRPSATSGTAIVEAVIDQPQAQSMVKLEVSVRLVNVEVREAGTDTLVTAIEILSPVNKRAGLERQKYLRKRRELLRSEVHVMEIDLLRGGQRTPLEIRPPPAPYYVTLAHAEHRPYVDVWPIQLETRLPVLPVPLCAPDADVPLDLGAIVRSVYAQCGYVARIDYRQPPPPPALTDEQAAWVEVLLSPYRR